jgi:putative nucleotidyltransferase with HDIG domain
MAAGVGAGIAATRALPRPSGPVELGLLWVAGFTVSTLVLFGANRVLRRLLPLAALLELSLTFPDHTPSRLGVALRAGNLRSATRRDAAMASAATAGGTTGIQAVLALAAALSEHDRATRGHSERVRAYTELLCEELHLPQADRVRLRWASLLHDVGKMAVPASLLNQQGKLDDHDWAMLRRHPEEGARLTASLAPWLGPWAKAIEQHHERWDGAGYPRGLAGTEIQQGARIVAVADAYEVMTAARAYKKPISAGDARARLAADAGRQFDPQVVRAFLSLSMGRIRIATGPLTWLAQVPFLRPAAVVARGPATVALGGALAAAAVTLAMPPMLDAPTPAVPVAAPRGLPRDSGPQVVALVVSSPPPAPPAAELAPVTDLIPQQPAPTEVPTLASEHPQEQADPPTPPPAPSTSDPGPPPDAPQTPTPRVHGSAARDGPVAAGLAVGVGDAEALPIAPIDVTVALP